MSVLGDIVSTIFSHHSVSASSPASTGSPVGHSKPSAAQVGQPPAQGTPVDVVAVMDKLASQSKEQLDWRRSIVDMMKLLKLDSSIGARKRLAGELHYSGNMNDSASMNVWLHKQVMNELAENGGKVPNDLKV